jgi:hypothetical protein
MLMMMRRPEFLMMRRPRAAPRRPAPPKKSGPIGLYITTPANCPDWAHVVENGPAQVADVATNPPLEGMADNDVLNVPR